MALTNQEISIRIRPGDSVETRVQQILKQFHDGGKYQVITVTNTDPSCQKMISIIELAKQQILEDKHESIHQYNKIEHEVSSKPPKKSSAAATRDRTSELPSALDEKKRTEFVYPKLTVKLSHHSLTLTEEDGWYHQKIT